MTLKLIGYYIQSISYERVSSVDIMTAEQAAQAAKGLTFENVWAALMEMKESQMETKKRLDESQQRIEKNLDETKKRLDESQQRIEKNLADFKKNTEKTINDLSSNLGGLGNSLGRLTEALLTAELWEKFSDLGIPVTRQSNRMKFRDGKRVLTEVDLLIENGEYMILVEVKTDMTIRQVDNHIKRIGIVRRYLDDHNDSRKIMGAVAGGAAVADDVMKYAQQEGLYVVVQSGDTIELADMPDGIKAREW